MVKTLDGGTTETKNTAQYRCRGGRMPGVLPWVDYWVPAEGVMGR